MKVLGVDYGRRKVGLAIAESRIARPLRVIKYSQTSDLLKKLDQLIQQEEVEEIVMGVSEGVMGEESKRFGKLLQSRFNLSVHFQDETLSTHDAQELSREAGIGQKKRRALEDAYSAAVILQSYTDSNV